MTEDLRFGVIVNLTSAAQTKLGEDRFDADPITLNLLRNVHLGDTIALPDGTRLRVLRRVWRLDAEPPHLQIELDWPARG
ncbi:hypothetical protein [Mameliella sediminis]|uniref:hypothetical protein n=1 Tax=Mameliella sediminis TaxID=2836866 RepID=UPI001C44C003|nr:hypothetical protein [Mameliella sediminis]MBY6115318.1 hypothetical protein [Antarctobacter heliothermus]MBY6144617.1 hypothetical protein [Mameliella alba]MBV7395731.1 hypothetical protein [Mameliella sediminis]MBY6160144.1 hypothetical protein [Mameliella alba]MBY6168614.1 hypothetical protein [Mameliella alba]